MVNSGLIALGLGVAGTYLATETLGSGSDSGNQERSIMGGFSGRGRGISRAQGIGGGIPDNTPNISKTVNYSPTSVSKNVNVNTQPRAGSGTKKQEKSSGSSNDSGGSGGGSSTDISINTTKKESNSTNDITRASGEDDSGDGTPYTDTGGFASDTAGVQSTKKEDVTKELNNQQGITRSMTTKELETPDLGGQTKKENKASSQFGQGSITSGDFFRGSIF